MSLFINGWYDSASEVKQAKTVTAGLMNVDVNDCTLYTSE